jgi:DNA polymerase-3 subunit delta'
LLEQLIKAIKSDLLVHAYLLIGDKSKMLGEALETAMAVNCLYPVGGYACGECLSCRKIRHGNHPDVVIVEPRGATLKIDQIREVQRSISFTHFEGRYKIVIFLDANKMTLEAANSLLKVLEEPPSGTLFILVAENGDNILPTVLSRCQVVKVGGKASNKWEDMADGNQQREQVQELIGQLTSMDLHQLLRLSDSWDKDRDSVKRIMEYLLIWLRDIAVAKISRNGSLLFNPSMFESVINSDIKAETAVRAALEVQNSRRQIEQNANTKLVLNVLLIKMQRLIRLEERNGESSWCEV